MEKDGQIVLSSGAFVLDRVENDPKKFFQSVHTQEVTGPSPVVSTKKFLISQEIRNFSLFYALEKLSVFSGIFALTHTPLETAAPGRTGEENMVFTAIEVAVRRIWLVISGASTTNRFLQVSNYQDLLLHRAIDTQLPLRCDMYVIFQTNTVAGGVDARLDGKHGSRQ